MGIGEGRNQSVRPFNGHIDISGQIIRAIDMIADHSHAFGFANQLFALGITPDGRQQGRAHTKAAQGHRDIHRHAARQARDAPRHV